MTEEKFYDYIIDGSNVLHESKKWGDEKTEFEGKMVDAINVDRIKLALTYFQSRGYEILICVDFSTHKKYTEKKLPIKPSRRAFNKFFSDNKDITQKIQSDSDMVKLKQENPGSIIVTNDFSTKKLMLRQIPLVSLKNNGKKKLRLSKNLDLRMAFLPLRARTTNSLKERS
jgi:hypothetical protein